MTTAIWKTVVWERLNKGGKWCPYSGEVSQLLEQSYGKGLNSVWLGDADMSLKVYTVNLKDMLQISEATGKKHAVQRRLCDKSSSVASAIMWQWRGDGHDSWHCYSPDISDIIESTFQTGKEQLDLSSQFPDYPYQLNFLSMVQKNMHSKYHRPIRRITTKPYPVFKLQNGLQEEAVVASAPQDNSVASSKEATNLFQKKFLTKQVSNLWNKITKSSDLATANSSSDDSPMASVNKKQCVTKLYPELFVDDSEVLYVTSSENGYSSPDPCANGPESPEELSSKFATVYGKPWKNSWPPTTPKNLIKPVPGIDPLPSEEKKSKRKGKKKKAQASAIETDDVDVFSEFTEELPVMPESDSEQMCIICYEPLGKGSSYDGDTKLLKLLLCSHIFHKSCIKAMYESGSKDNHLQCPTCKTIHGIKRGIQPHGKMIYHVLPYSLPGYPDCDTIQIIYDIPSGTQGPEHPYPGHRYSARGFPRYCYLPDNEIGRKILRLLIKAWERRLIFTIGTSSTTSEQNTVTWNEIHHKTEFGCNRHGHGFPDPNYFENVIAELAAHGVTESTYSWHPV